MGFGTVNQSTNHAPTHTKNSSDQVTGPLGIEDYVSFQETSTPATPPVDEMNIFARANGANVEVWAQSNTGAEVLLGSLADTAGGNTMLFNLIEG